MTTDNNIIFHIDVNSAFLSWSAADMHKKNPDSRDLRETVCVVGGDEKMRHGVVLAKSISAKKYGIKTGEALMTARKKYPGLQVIPPDYKLYRSSSHSLIELLSEYSESVHQFSIDEAFIEIRRPDLKQLNTEKTVKVPVLFRGNVYSSTELADKLRHDIFTKLGFTVNIGISVNKLLAKMASDFEKPDKTHTLFPEEIEKKMWPLPVGDLLFAGKKTVEKMRTLGIHTIGELADMDRYLLVSHLGKHGGMLWDLSHGDDSMLNFDHSSSNKGYSHSITLAKDLAQEKEAGPVLLMLCEKISKRLRLDKACAKTISVSILFSDFTGISRQASMSAPTSSATEFYDYSRKLISSVWSGKPVRQLGVHISNISHGETYQLKLFDNDKREKLARLDSMMDNLRDKFGTTAVMRASLLPDRKSDPQKSSGEIPYSHSQDGLKSDK